MTRSLHKLLDDVRGVTIIEFAIALPVLVTFIWGIFQIGLLFMAYAGMQHALGQAARFATIYPTPANDSIKTKVAANKFGTGNGTLEPLSIVEGTSGGTGPQYKTLSLTYRQPLNFLFFQGPNVTLTQSKRVYVAS
ncbi:MAG: pilus assembly protein [Sphingomonas sp.]|nr:pilus assembly protein [Sphingomonas sp.]